VAEVGGGCLRNALYLLELGLDTTVFEFPSVVARFKAPYETFGNRGGRLVTIDPTVPQGNGLLRAARNAQYRARSFDFVVMTYVIETICQPETRRGLLRGCRTLLKRGGMLLLAVRGGADVAPAYAKGKECCDGYITPLRTFIRAYSKGQLRALLQSCGFGAIEFLHRTDCPAPELLYTVVTRD